MTNAENLSTHLKILDGFTVNGMDYETIGKNSHRCCSSPE